MLLLSHLKKRERCFSDRMQQATSSTLTNKHLFSWNKLLNVIPIQYTPLSSMKITYNAPSKVERTVELNESDFPPLYGAIRDCFLQRLKSFGLSNPFFPFEYEAIEFCRTAGVDTTNRIDVVEFFETLLLRGTPEVSNISEEDENGNH